MNYIIRDKEEIIGIFDSLEDSYQHVIDLICFSLKYNNNIKNIIKTLQIIEYKKHLAKDFYYLTNDLILKNSNNNNITFNNIFINNKINKFINNENNDLNSSEINIFIPMNVEDNNIEDINEIDIEKLKENIELLEKLKDNEEKNLEELQDEYKVKEDNYMNDKIKFDSIKLKMKQEQEKWESIQKKFDADKKLYFIIKDEINFGQRDINNIPYLFKDAYQILKKLDDENLLNTSNELNLYMELIKNINNEEIDYSDLFNNDIDIRFKNNIESI